MKYKILTSRSVMDIPYENEEQHQRDCEALIEEQNKIITERCPSKYYKCHFIEDKYFLNDNIMYMDCLEEAIQYLAIKDGVDLVQFENGKLGYVAYYNGHENMFEFEPCSEEEYMNN